MKNIIAHKEFTTAKRDRRFLTAGGVVLALMLVATLTGFLNYRTLQNERERANQEARTQWVMQKDKNPHSAAHYGTFAFRPKSELSFLDFGLDTYTGVSVYLEGHRQNDAKFSQAENATSLVRVGEMTVAFVLQLLLPLLIVFLCFNTFTQERDESTLKVLLSQGVSMLDIFWGKVQGLAQITSLVVVPSLVLASAMLLARTGFELGGDVLLRMLFFALLYSIYFLIFIVLSVFVSAHSKGSRESLLTLLAIWIFACVVMPKATVNLGENLFKAPSKIEFNRAIHEDEEKGIDGHDPSDARAKVLEKKILAQYKVDSLSQLPINFNGIQMQEGEKYTSMVYNKHFGRLQDIFQKQNSVSAYVSFINPFLAVRDLSMGLSGSDYQHFLDFKTRAETYRFKMVEFLNDYMTYHSKTGDWESKVGGDFWKKVPDFQYKNPSVGWVLQQHRLSLLALMVFSMGLFGVVSRGIKTISIL